jgi:putative flippase GtrA
VVGLARKLGLVVGREEHGRTEALLAFAKSEKGLKFLKYAAGSGISAIISQIAFILSFGPLHLFDARGSSIFATFVGMVPSYFLNRNWAWKKRSRSSVSREVIPYVVMAIIGLVFSTWSVDFADSHSHFLGHAHILRVLFVSGTYFMSFAVLWFAKFAFLNRYLFGDGSERQRRRHRQGRASELSESNS